MASPTTSTRNLAIDWIKGWMILCVVLVHTWAFPDIKFYLAVDVFFYISGYYLMLSFLRKPTTTVQYTWKRIKAIALPFLICIGFRFLQSPDQFIAWDGLDSFIDTFAKAFFTITFSEELGIEVSSDGLLIGSWYFSVLIISSFLLYGMLEYNQKFSSRVLFPMIALVGFNALIVHSESFSSWTRVGALGFPLLRGFTEMTTGALICSVYQENKAAFEKHPIFLNVMGIFAFILFVLLIFAKQHFDKYLVITIPWFLLAAVSDNAWLSKGLEHIRGGIMAWVGQYTLYILCVHWPVIVLVLWCNEHLWGLAFSGIWLMIICVLAVFPATFVLVQICKWIRKRLSNR